MVDHRDDRCDSTGNCLSFSRFRNQVSGGLGEHGHLRDERFWGCGCAI
jgi:hypothetical protein